MKKFEIGKTYTSGDGIEIVVEARTDKTVTFKYTKKNWFELDIEKSYRRKIEKYSCEYESIRLGSHWSAPSIEAI